MAAKAPRSWGYWTEGKLDLLTKYLDAFTTATKKKARARVYLDAFAGEGRGRSRRWRPRSGVNGSGAGSTVMLGGGCDGLVDHLLWGGRVEELAAQVL
jgi:hypothetical protein